MSELPGVVPMLSYREGRTAMDWLARVFGFQVREAWFDDDDVLTHGEMWTGSGLIMMATPSQDYEGPALHRKHCRAAAAWSSVPWVVDGVLVHVHDVEAHFARARAEGAATLSDVEDGPAGSRLYRVEDVEGHRWMFRQL